MTEDELREWNRRAMEPRPRRRLSKEEAAAVRQRLQTEIEHIDALSRAMKEQDEAEWEKRRGNHENGGKSKPISDTR